MWLCNSVRGSVQVFKEEEKETEICLLEEVMERKVIEML